MIFRFIKNPCEFVLNSEGNKKSFWKESPVLFLKVLLVLFLMSFAHLVISIIISPSSALDSNNNFLDNLNSFVSNTPLAYLWMILLGPIYEEISFRMGLNFKKNSFIISFLLIIFFLSGGTLFFNSIDVSYINNLVIRIIPLTILYFLVNKYITQSHMVFLKRRYYNIIIWTFAIIFSVLHLSNYSPYEVSQIPFYILIVFAFFYISMTLSYIRIRHGLIYSIIFHCGWNLLQVIANKSELG